MTRYIKLRPNHGARALVALALLCAAACTPKQIAHMLTDTNEPLPTAKRKAQPARPYLITMVIDNAPGPFASIEGIAQFDVENESQCGYINPHSGVSERITSNERFAVRKVADNHYQGVMYADLMQDEDYFGRGVCRWQLTEVRFALMATGVEAETTFVPRIDAQDILAQRSVKYYFWKGNYPRTINGGYGDSGDLDRSRFHSHIQDSDIFTIALSAEDSTP